MIHTAGAGPAPIHHKSLNSKVLMEGISFCLTDKASMAAKQIASKMRREDGVKNAVESFHNNLPMDDMRCDILHDEAAAWRYKVGDKIIRLSKLAAEMLVVNKQIERSDLRQYVIYLKFNVSLDLYDGKHTD